MRRLRSWIVVAAVGALALAATLDALRSERPEATQRPAAPEAQSSRRETAAVARELREEGVRGVLTYSDEACAVHAVVLPDLGEHPATAERSCRFTTSAGNVFSVGPAVPDPRSSLVASCDGGAIEVRTRYGMLVGRAGGCAPSWKPNGILTALRDGAVVELHVRRGRRALVPRLLVSRRALARALSRAPWRLRRPQFQELAWLSNARFAAVVSDVASGEDILAIFERGRFLSALPFTYNRLSDLRVSPRGHYVAAKIGDEENVRGLLVLDARGRYLSLALRTGRAIAWSPDEQWIAVAASDGVYVLPADGRTPRLIRLPVTASDVFWR